jgi:thiol-disulfide isomerase/thioredoxin
VVALSSDRSPSRPHRARTRTVAAVILAATVLAAVAYRFGDGGDAIHEAVSERRATPAPELNLELLTAGDLGETPRRWWRAARDGHVALHELRGSPVVINFWTARCTPCREETPALERAARNAGHSVLVLGVGSGGTPEEARSYVDTLGFSFPQGHDNSGETARRWAVDGVPETFFVTRDGDIVGHVVGASSAADLRRGVAAAVSGRPSGLWTGGRREALE